MTQPEYDDLWPGGPRFVRSGAGFALGTDSVLLADFAAQGKLSDTELVEIVRENFDLRPAGIIKMLDLRRPIYKQTAAYGHFGRTDVELPWENTDKAEDLKKYLK